MKTDLKNQKNFEEEARTVNILTFKRIYFIFTLSLLLFVLLIFSCGCVDAGNGDEITAEEPSWNKDNLSHGSNVNPDYSTVFPDDEVQVINIKISPENWQMMLDNMTEIYGESGTSGTSGMHGPNTGERNGSTEINLENLNAQNRNISGVMAQEMSNGGKDGMENEITPVYVTSDVTFENLEWEDVGIRFKGQMSLRESWSKGSGKISFKLNFDKFEDENPAIKNQRFYGFDELNLQSAYGDDSLMRDMIVPKIFRESGVPAPYTAFYRVYVDFGEGPVYFGLYTMVESIEDTVIETQFEGDSGNVYKPQGQGATFIEGTFDTEAFEKKTNEDEADWSDVESLYEILNSDLRTQNSEEWREELESVFDVDEFLRWLATNTVIQNWDTYGGNCRNFYLYTDPSNGKITWIPWDNNYALRGGMSDNSADFPGEKQGLLREIPGSSAGEMQMNMPENISPAGVLTKENKDDFGQGMGGNKGGGMGNSLSLSLDDAGDEWPLIRYLADDPVYYEKYIEYLEMVATESFEPQKMEELYTRYHSMIEPYVTGTEGETEGYSHLNSPNDFTESLDELIDHSYSRNNAVMAFISEK